MNQTNQKSDLKYRSHNFHNTAEDEENLSKQDILLAQDINLISNGF